MRGRLGGRLGAAQPRPDGEALAIQRELKAELLAAEENDPYVDEELQLLTGGPDSPTSAPPS